MLRKKSLIDLRDKMSRMQEYVKELTNFLDGFKKETSLSIINSFHYWENGKVYRSIDLSKEEVSKMISLKIDYIYDRMDELEKSIESIES